MKNYFKYPILKHLKVQRHLDLLITFLFQPLKYINIISNNTSLSTYCSIIIPSTPKPIQLTNNFKTNPPSAAHKQKRKIGEHNCTGNLAFTLLYPLYRSNNSPRRRVYIYIHAIQHNQIHGIRCVADIEVRRNGRYVMPGIYRKRGGRAPKGSRRITLSWNFAGCLACPYHSRAINFIPVLKDILSTPAITTTICHHISVVSVRDVRKRREKKNRTLGHLVYIILFIFLGDTPVDIFKICILINSGCKEKVAKAKTINRSMYKQICLILFHRYLLFIIPREILFLVFSFL